MLNLLIALLAALAVAVGVRLAGFPLVAAIIPGTVVLLGVYIALARRVFKKIQAVTSEAYKELSAPSTSQKEIKQRAEKAIKVLESGLVWSRWQFLVASQLHGAIGQIKYLVKDLDGALAELNQANARDYMAQAMKGALFFQRKQYDEMKKAFEAAVKAGKKEGVVWATYAWCLLQLKEKDQALAVMARAVQANPSDEKLKAALVALQNDKKLKMKAWEPLWWNFGLEAPPVQQMGPRVKFVRR